MNRKSKKLFDRGSGKVSVFREFLIPKTVPLPSWRFGISTQKTFAADRTA
jgi:hypothetical protein